MNYPQYPQVPQVPQDGSIYNLQESEERAAAARGFIARVYAWMAFGLLVTTVAAFVTVSIPGLLQTIVGSPIFIGLIIGELALVIILSAAVRRLSPAVAGMLFTAYAALNGVTLSVILLIYTSASIAVTFGVTACTFGIMTLFGFTTKRDLTKLGSLLIMGLIGVILASIVNIFLRLPAIYWVVTILGILIFVGLVAYDTQKLKRMSQGLTQDGQMMQKASVLGALALYLDFINLFLLLLRLLGRGRK